MKQTTRRHDDGRPYVYTSPCKIRIKMSSGGERSPVDVTLERALFGPRVDRALDTSDGGVPARLTLNTSVVAANAQRRTMRYIHRPAQTGPRQFGGPAGGVYVSGVLPLEACKRSKRNSQHSLCGSR